MEQLGQRLQAIAQETPYREVRIDASGQLPWHHVVPVIDLCKFHGLTRVALKTL